MEVNLQPLLDATAPIVGIPTPGRGGLVFDRLLIQRGLRGVTITKASIGWRGDGQQRALIVEYTHANGRGRAVFVDQRDAGTFSRYRGGLHGKLEAWAHRERHKRGKPCLDRYCPRNTRYTFAVGDAAAETPKARARLRYAAKLGDGESVEW